LCFVIESISTVLVDIQLDKGESYLRQEVDGRSLDYPISDDGSVASGSETLKAGIDSLESDHVSMYWSERRENERSQILETQISRHCRGGPRGVHRMSANESTVVIDSRAREFD
jgi:hypothetical protein